MKNSVFFDLKYSNAGTSLLPEESGHKAIESIEIGDKVWAYNEETGEQELKEVTRLFRNETDTWVHVHISECVDTDSQDEIVCTPEHPFYVLNADSNTRLVNLEGRNHNENQGKWVSSIDLKPGMQVLLANGKYGTIDIVEVEELDIPEVTYNFEVADLHNYFVGSEGILVHNTCAEVQKIFKEFGVDNFDDLAANFTPDEMMGKLDGMGYSKSISMKNPNSPATMMSSPNGKLTFRIQTINPQGGTAYFRAFNAGGGALNSTGIFPSWAGTAEMRQLTHFYFGG